ncbi:hypothetical protein TNCV_347741 [Trichonephila clavipes]|nr:hypothetical protein TNCV_347741 [Trichonephila clavipes]
MAENLITLSSLSDEVLVNIFQYLNISNRLTASMVCKRWFYTINCHKLLQDVKVSFLKEIRMFSNLIP